MCECVIVTHVATGHVLSVGSCPECMRAARRRIHRALDNLELQGNLALSASAAEPEPEVHPCQTREMGA